MNKSYFDYHKEANYKLTGNGERTIQQLVDSIQNVDPTLEADIYGNGAIINEFEQEFASLFQMESAVFFPSGTMAQQIALRIWCDHKKNPTVAYHPLCHLEIHEKDGLKELHHIQPILLGESHRLFTIDDLKNIEKPISCLLIELPQREIGGQLPSWEELVALSSYCKSNGIYLHLDGARLFEVVPYYNKSLAEISSLFDSVYVSFYKGLGGIAGAMLLGPKDFIQESKLWKRRHGGDLISLYPYILNAKYSLNLRMHKMNNYYEYSKFVANKLNAMSKLHTLPIVPVSNMFHLFYDLPKEQVEKIYITVIEKHNVSIVGNVRAINEHSSRSELSFGDSFEKIPSELLEEVFTTLEQELNCI